MLDCRVGNLLWKERPLQLKACPSIVQVTSTSPDLNWLILGSEADGVKANGSEKSILNEQLFIRFRQ